MTDQTVLQSITDHFGIILNSVLLAAVGGLAKMINSRFKEVAEQQEKTNIHLATLNNRVHKAEQSLYDNAKLAETIQTAHAETRRHCQDTNKREFDSVWRTLFQTAMKNKEDQG
jgi:predicted Holliday junction resolvase-like endonuclease